MFPQQNQNYHLLSNVIFFILEIWHAGWLGRLGWLGWRCFAGLPGLGWAGWPPTDFTNPMLCSRFGKRSKSERQSALLLNVGTPLGPVYV